MKKEKKIVIINYEHLFKNSETADITAFLTIVNNCKLMSKNKAILKFEQSFKICKCVTRRKKMDRKINENGMTKPSIELDDFYSLLDPKVVEKIKSTSQESISRISNDVNNIEYEIQGAKNILELL